jgi:LPPG:FO 2-phospho-L-lactate transferase
MKIVYLSGGVGGARLLHGLAAAAGADAVTAVVNTGDDFEHWGLHISPDLDTVMYTLAELAPIWDGERGWGLRDETFAALGAMQRLGGEDWFQLGDRDLATHLLRTEALRRGESLSAVTARLCGALGIGVRVLPMAETPCRTMLDTDEGTLSFQVWFVRRRAQPVVRRVWFEGAPPPAPSVLPAIAAADVVVIGPSNPYVSIDPILSRPGVRAALGGRKVVAVSPIVGGRAVKGPLGAMIPQLGGEPPSAAAVAHHYEGLLGGIIVERGDEVPGLRVVATDTLMRSRADSRRLADELLAFAERLG